MERQISDTALMVYHFLDKLTKEDDEVTEDKIMSSTVIPISELFNDRALRAVAVGYFKHANEGEELPTWVHLGNGRWKRLTACTPEEIKHAKDISDIPRDFQ